MDPIYEEAHDWRGLVAIFEAGPRADKASALLVQAATLADIEDAFIKTFGDYVASQVQVIKERLPLARRLADPDLGLDEQWILQKKINGGGARTFDGDRVLEAAGVKEKYLALADYAKAALDSFKAKGEELMKQHSFNRTAIDAALSRKAAAEAEIRAEAEKIRAERAQEGGRYNFAAAQAELKEKHGYAAAEQRYEEAAKRFYAEFDRTGADPGPELRAARDKAAEELNQVTYKVNDGLRERFEQQAAKQTEAQERAKVAAFELSLALALEGEKLLKSISEQSQVSQEQADQWFDTMVLADKRSMTALKRRGYDTGKLKSDMTEFYRLTGGRLSRISFDLKGGGRAAAQPLTGVVYVAGEFSKATLFHELAHVLEDDERNKAASNEFLDRRTGRKEGKRAQGLKAMTGANYKPGERAWDGGFINPYVGKSYPNGITEVFSMGLQYFADPRSLMTLAERDPDHFNFMLGFVATPPVPDEDKVQAQQAAQAQAIETEGKKVDFEKQLEKKIAAAGDFWTERGFLMDTYRRYGRKTPMYYAYGPENENGRRSMSGYFTSEKALRRILWIHIAAGQPGTGPLSLMNLSYAKKLPQEVLDNADSILAGGPL